MLFLVVLRMFPEKFSFGISFAPSEPNALRLQDHLGLVFRSKENASIFKRAQLCFGPRTFSKIYCDKTYILKYVTPPPWPIARTTV